MERLAIALYAEGVRSISRLLAHAEPQQLRSPQKELVSGPQSAIDTLTQAPLHWLVT
ncbi:MAG: hypothetical protein ACRDP6_20865 [Actinoallomurus sp.]